LIKECVIKDKASTIKFLNALLDILKSQKNGFVYHKIYTTIIFWSFTSLRHDDTELSNWEYDIILKCCEVAELLNYHLSLCNLIVEYKLFDRVDKYNINYVKKLISDIISKGRYNEVVSILKKTDLLNEFSASDFINEQTKIGTLKHFLISRRVVNALGLTNEYSDAYLLELWKKGIIISTNINKKIGSAFSFMGFVEKNEIHIDTTDIKKILAINYLKPTQYDIKALQIGDVVQCEVKTLRTDFRIHPETRKIIVKIYDKLEGFREANLFIKDIEIDNIDLKILNKAVYPYQSLNCKILRLSDTFIDVTSDLSFIYENNKIIDNEENIYEKTKKVKISLSNYKLIDNNFKKIMQEKIGKVYEAIVIFQRKNIVFLNINELSNCTAKLKKTELPRGVTISNNQKIKVSLISFEPFVKPVCYFTLVQETTKVIDIEDTIDCKIIKIIPSRVFVKIENETRKASIYIGELTNQRLANIYDFEYNDEKLHIGQKLIAKVIGIDEKFGIQLSLKQVKNGE